MVLTKVNIKQVEKNGSCKFCYSKKENTTLLTAHLQWESKYFNYKSKKKKKTYVLPLKKSMFGLASIPQLNYSISLY